MCIGPRAIAIAEANGDTTVGYRENRTSRIAGTVLRQTYLGDARDILIGLGSAQIRVAAPLSVDRTVGSTIHLEVPNEACRVVSGD